MYRLIFFLSFVRLILNFQRNLEYIQIGDETNLQVERGAEFIHGEKTFTKKFCEEFDIETPEVVRRKNLWFWDEKKKKAVLRYEHSQVEALKKMYDLFHELQNKEIPIQGT